MDEIMEIVAPLLLFLVGFVVAPPSLANACVTHSFVL